MKQVLFDGKGKLLIKEVPAPPVPANGALVRVAYSLISSGTESVAAAGGGSLLRKALSQPQLAVNAARMALREGLRVTADVVRDVAQDWFEVGYSAAGTVVEVGPETEGLQVGQRVACAGAGYANHAEYVAVPRNLITPLPDGASLRAGAFATLGAIALQGVRRTEVTLGETVVVVGLGLVGQLAAQILKAAGCRVIGSDPIAERRAWAEQLAAAQTIDPAAADSAQAVVALTGGQGADKVILCAATRSSEPVNQAFRMCRERGRVVMVGAMGMDLDRAEFYDRELDFVISRAYGPGRYDRAYEETGVDYPLGHVRWTEGRNLAAFVQLIADGNVNVDALVTAEEPVERAETAYTHVLSGEPGALAALLTYGPAGPAAPPERLLRLRADAPPTGKTRAAVVGAGNFARAVHLPNLKVSPLFEVRAVDDHKGTTAQRAAAAANAAYATTDYGEILADPDVDAVFIATRHDLHAEMAAAAARAGKHVFVEKPLGITVAECETVLEAVEETGALLTVGFNRRFAPTSQALKAAVAGTAGPKMVTYRVNAGPLPPNHWLLDPAIGGGRLVGEGCHFFDYVCWLVDSEPVRLTAQAVTEKGDALPQDFVVTLHFADGSVGSVIYTGLGSLSFGKERVEVLAGGGVAVMEDFQSLTLHGLPGQEVRSRTGQKGYRAHLANFGAALRGETPLGVTAQDGLRATFIAEKALEAIRGGGALDLRTGG